MLFEVAHDRRKMTSETCHLALICFEPAILGASPPNPKIFLGITLNQRVVCLADRVGLTTGAEVPIDYMTKMRMDGWELEPDAVLYPESRRAASMLMRRSLPSGFVGCRPSV